MGGMRQVGGVQHMQALAQLRQQRLLHSCRGNTVQLSTAFSVLAPLPFGSPDVGPEHAACNAVSGVLKQRLRVQRRRGVAV